MKGWLPPEVRAWCGAQSGFGNASMTENWSGLKWQLKQFEPPDDIANVMISVWIGINDLYELQNPHTLILDNVLDVLKKLAASGAKHLLVLNIPDISMAPAYQQAPYRALRKKVSKTIESYNQMLEKAILGDDGLINAYKNSRWSFIDAAQMFNKLSSHYRIVDRPWLDTYAFPKQDEYMWWDNWHPMSSVHERIAKEILNTVF
tara:strand:- start:2320 stop:2931 length:612 start_codon:yes stop_codon:yes gene_type:complete